ncbi:E2/UBC family protein [Candidatus Binatus sp.]|uniref:E2/UBC family protein n=1 Tax=Candidatus Binatus sp. TaxID=2811406 RepID=UPI0039C88628
MTPIIEQQLAALQQERPEASAAQLPSGAHLITIPNVTMPPGWSVRVVTILFVAPPGYPAAQPDCFWVEPKGLRLENGKTPQNTNDANPIPEVQPPRDVTWFSWHLQHWNPNQSSLLTYCNVIMQRLSPAR